MLKKPRKYLPQSNCLCSRPLLRFILLFCCLLRALAFPLKSFWNQPARYLETLSAAGCQWGSGRRHTWGDQCEFFLPSFCVFWSKTAFLGKELHYYKVFIAYCSELKWQICNYGQNSAFVAKIANTRLTKILIAFFALAEKLPTSATLLWAKIFCMLNINALWMLHIFKGPTKIEAKPGGVCFQEGKNLK